MLVEFDNVAKIYKGGMVALDSVNLSVDRGEFVFLSGPSGAGKTTLLRLIYMDERPTKGEVRVGEFRSSQISGRQVSMLRRKVGVVFQDFRLLKELTAFENVLLPLRAAGKKYGDLRKRANSVLYSVGLSSKRHQFPMKLSGGEQQRVVIARAMALRPSILIADEPTGSLDQPMGDKIMSLFEELNKQGTAILVATHDKSIMKRFDHPQIKLKAGHII